MYNNLEEFEKATEENVGSLDSVVVQNENDLAIENLLQNSETDLSDDFLNIFDPLATGQVSESDSPLQSMMADIFTNHESNEAEKLEPTISKEIDNILDQPDTQFSDDFLNFFFEMPIGNTMDSDTSLLELMTEICDDNVLKASEEEVAAERKEQDEVEMGNNENMRPALGITDLALDPSLYGDQNRVEKSGVGPIRKTKKEKVKKLYRRAPVLAVVNQEVTHILDTPVFGVINTKEVVEDIKSWSKKAGVNQTVFAEKVLEKTQGHYSVISRNPAPWEELLAPGRAVFVRMHNFMKLSDEEKMKILSVEKVSEKKDLQEQKKKTRFTYSKEQMEVLMEIYKVNNQPGNELIEELAERFSLYPNQINNFFLNRRRRAKRSNL